MAGRRAVGALIVAVVSAGCLIGAGAAMAADYYPTVDTDGTNSGSSCLSPPSGTCTLRDAILKAGNGSVDATVNLQPGHTYHLTANSPLLPAGSIVSPAHSVTINGDGATLDLSGNGGNSGLAGGAGSGARHDLVISDLTISGSQGAPAISFNGTASALSIDSSTLAGNTSTSGGPAGLSVGAASTVAISNTTITGNHGLSTGGVDIEGVQGATTLTNVLFTQNQGDAIETSFNTGPVSLDRVSFRGNTGPTYQGTVALNDSGAGISLHHVDVENNNAPSAFSPTVRLTGALTRLDDVTIAGNTARPSNGGGGVSLNITGNATANNWTVAGNTAVAPPSGVAVGGGINVTGGTLKLNHATVTDNSASGNADDLHTSGTGAITVQNSIVAGSSASGAVPCAADGGPIASAGHNIDLGTSCHFTATGDRSNTDPRLGPLTSNTTFDPFALGTRALLYASPAVDAADAPNCPADDELGTLRPQGVACDIGAIESPQVDLRVTGSANVATLPPGGGNATYTFTVGNNTGTTPAGVTFTDALPVGARVVSASAGQGTCSTQGAARVVCALGAVHRGSDVTVRVVAALTAPGLNRTTAHVESELPDRDMTTDNTTVAVTVSPSVVVSTRPVLTKLKVTPRTVKTSKQAKAAAITYRDSTRASTTLTISRKGSGVRSGKKCVKPPKHRSKHAKSCTRWTVAKHVKHSDVAGSNKVKLPRGLKPGSYRVQAVAKAGKLSSKTATATFTLKVKTKR
jgi:uncharacterized repeat protein (TIGR01451 family)